jgi:hypothetical protein
VFFGFSTALAVLLNLPPKTDIKARKIDLKLQLFFKFPLKMFDKVTILGVLFIVASCAAWVDVVSNWDDPGPRETQHGPTLQISQGLIRGEVEFYDGFRSHISYKGIPYAQGQSMLLIALLLITHSFSVISAGWRSSVARTASCWRMEWNPIWFVIRPVVSAVWTANHWSPTAVRHARGLSLHQRLHAKRTQLDWIAGVLPHPHGRIPR